MTTYDQLDFHILTSIISFKKIKFSQIINTYPFFDRPKKFETSNQKNLFHNGKIGVIKHRLKKFMREDLVFIEKGEDRSNIYVVNMQKVKLLNKHKFINKYKKAIWIKERDGIECIFSL